MTMAVFYGLLAFIFFLVILYSLDLIVFLLREKKLLDENCQDPDYIMYLELKQEKSKHPQKKNYYLYLFCIVLCANGQFEKVERLLPFLRDDALLGVYKSDFQ